jgi:HEAT repeat protein
MALAACPGASASASPAARSPAPAATRLFFEGIPALQQQSKELATRLAKAVTDDNDFTVRRHAAAALAKLPDQQAIAGPAMLRAASDKDPRVRKIALAALSHTAAPADAVTILAKAANDPDSDTETRQIVLTSLSGLGREARPAIPALITALKDKDPQIRRLAADAIGMIQSAPPVQVETTRPHDPSIPVDPASGAPGRPGR